MSKETENLVSQFKVIPHLEEKGEVIELPNGMRKTSNGLIIDPSKLDLLLHPKAAREPEVTYVEEEEEEEAPPRRASAKVARKGAARKQAAPQPPPPPARRRVTVRLIVPGVGEIPTQYEKVLRGKGVMVLGVFSGSFIPRQAALVDGELSGVVVFAEWPDERYVFNGWEFRDENGTRCLVMVKVPERQNDSGEDMEPEYMEEPEDDEEGEQ